MFDSFRKGLSPLQDDAVRAQLRDAILARDPERFREILVRNAPELAKDEARLYVVYTLGGNPVSIVPIFVDYMGHPLKEGEPLRPFEQLNADIVGDQMVITIGDEVYSATIGPVKDVDEPPPSGAE